MFKITWNLLVGVMTLSPSPFFTRHHRDHHNCKYYGTPEDPEYVVNFLPGGGGRWGAFAICGGNRRFPLAGVLAFSARSAHISFAQVSRVRAAPRLRAHAQLALRAEDERVRPPHGDDRRIALLVLRGHDADSRLSRLDRTGLACRCFTRWASACLR